MQPETEPEGTYVLGNEPEELVRLDRQAAVIGPATRLLLQAAGIAPGMRILDLGTGLGHVARMAGELVGPQGVVLGIDRSEEALAAARRRTEEAAARHVAFLEAEVTGWRSPNPFDAVIERLLLFHVPDPVSTVRHHLQNLRPDGLFVAIDFDIGSARSEPPIPLVDEALRWVMQAFTTAGAWPRIGARLGPILEEAGLRSVTTFGVQGYLSPRDRSAAALLAGVVRSLAPAILQYGIATSRQIDVDTLEARIATELERADAVLLPPAVVGAWGQCRGA